MAHSGYVGQHSEVKPVSHDLAYSRPPLSSPPPPPPYATPHRGSPGIVRGSTPIEPTRLFSELDVATPSNTQDEPDVVIPSSTPTSLVTSPGALVEHHVVPGPGLLVPPVLYRQPSCARKKRTVYDASSGRYVDPKSVGEDV